LKNQEIPIVIVGSKDWKILDIDKLIDDLGINKRVIFSGFVLDNILPVIYSLATIFCFPSYAEGFGLPALEAMASGVPVVVSNTTSLPEICGDAGNYVNPNDPQDIAAMIDLLLKDNQLYNYKRSKGLERAKHFTWENSAKKLLECICKVVEN
jgi:glycosyltransferase involved in cell wall biosynthesis